MIHDIVTKVEVIADGSKVLYSMIPETGLFVHMCTVFAPPRLTNSITGTAFNFMRMKIPFGRHLRDEEYMLDTGQYNNVYLEAPWSLDTTKWATHTFRHTIRFLRPIQRLSPVGMVRTRDIEYGQHAWTAAGHYFVDLPMEYPWHTLGCRIFDIDQPVENVMTHIKLDIDDGRLILVDDDIDDMITDDTQYLPYPVHVHYKHNHVLADVSSYVQSLLGEVSELSGSQIGGTQGSLFWAGPFGQQCEYWIYDYLGAKVDARVNLSLHGTMYFCNQIIKHWWGGDPFPAKSHSSARIDYSHGAFTVTDLRTWLQELTPLKLA